MRLALLAFVSLLMAAALAAVPSCGTGGNCQYCTTSAACSNYACYWCGSSCSSNPCPPPTAISGLYRGLSDLCGGARDLLPVTAMLMVLIGAVVYAAGQVMGAETRARANVWATAALTGALVAMLISAVSPEVLKIIYGSAIHC